MSVLLKDHRKQHEGEATSDELKAGYFRIGHVVLAIPPEQIRTTLTSNNDSVLPIRSPFEMRMKSGQSRFDVSIKWRALAINNLGTVDWSMWENVRDIVAIFKAAPFVEVENAHLRSLFSTKDRAYKEHGRRMAFALRQLTIGTSADIVDGLDCCLDMTLFNHVPYSREFAYKGANNEPVSADASPLFRSYINRWKVANLDTPVRGQNQQAAETPADWRLQEPGAMKLVWRKYFAQRFLENDPALVVQEDDSWDGDVRITDLPLDHFSSSPRSGRGSKQETGDATIDNTEYSGVAFRYRTKTLEMSGVAGLDNPSGMVPQNVQVVMVNNLAQLPLANYQYPTYQHIGPAGTAISVFMTQKGFDKPGVPTLMQMTSELDDQYIRMRNQWRAVSSVHRMQAVFIHNQLLNMLGIYAVMPENVATQTVDESADMVQVQFTANQYENIFEQTSAYRVKAPMAGFKGVFKEILDTNPFMESKELADACGDVKEFWYAWRGNGYDPKGSDYLKGHDNSYLVKALIKADDAKPLIAALPAQGALELSETDLAWLRKSMDFVLRYEGMPIPVPVAGVSISTSWIPGMKDKGIPVTVSSDYPQLAARIRDGKPDYNTVWFFVNFMANNDMPEISEADRTCLNGLVSLLKDKTKQMDNLFEYVLSNKLQNAAKFQNEFWKMASMPKWKNKLQKALDKQDPGAGHGAYRDLGMEDFKDSNGRFNPAIYFYNDYEDDKRSVSDAANKALKDTKVLFESFRSVNTTEEEKKNGVPANFSKPVLADQLAIADGNISGILQRTQVPFRSMAAAFPAYKLFFMEEDNLGIYHALDDFYSYAAVIDIELERHQNRPDTLVLQLTNLAGLLSHKLYDNTTLGKLEKEWDRSGEEGFVASNGDVTTSAGRTNQNTAREYYGVNVMEGMDQNGKTNWVPNKFFALQTGSKVQLRIGYDNDPDKLEPVFTGQVTEMAGSEILAITCQSYQTELMIPAPDEINHDGYWPLGLFGSMMKKLDYATSDLITGHPIEAVKDITSFMQAQSPAYGGMRVFGDRGDAGSVMATLLKVSTAKHFGHWQVGRITDPYLKGFTWSALLGSWMDNNSKIGQLLRTGYNRRDENILIDHLINWDGTHSEKVFKRDFMFETPSMLVDIPPEYHVPNDPSLTPWQLIKDVSRRYPDYILKVAQYGFPYEAEATLVFAHPLDWYYKRAYLIGDEFNEKLDNNTDTQAFSLWWVGDKRSAFAEAVKRYSVLVPPGQGGLVKTIAQTHAWTVEDNNNVVVGKNAYGGIEFTIDSPESFINTVNRLIDDLNRNAYHILNKIVGSTTGDEPTQLANAFRSMKNSCTSFVQSQRSLRTMKPVPSNSRIRPVRYFHYVDHDQIIKNDIKLNENIFNTIRIGDESIAASEFIPSAYRRVLHADPLIINPKDNAPSQRRPLRMSYVQSFLKEEVGKMYRGELLIRGNEKIEPHDVLLLTDESTGLHGPIEVESVTHMFNQEMGFVTSIVPKALTMTNESATADLMQAFRMAMHNAQGIWNQMSTPAEQVVAGGVAGGAATGLVAGAMLGGPVGWVTAAVVAGGIMWAVGKNRDLSPLFVSPLLKFGRPWMGGLEGYRVGDITQWVKREWQDFYAAEIAPTIESYRELKGLLDDYAGDRTQAVTDLPVEASDSDNAMGAVIRPYVRNNRGGNATTETTPSTPTTTTENEAKPKKRKAYLTKPEQRAFLEKALAAAKEAGHIWPEYAAAEAALESNWGRSGLCQKANNLFGQKQGPTTRGLPTIDIRTREVIKGKDVIVDATWPKFNTWTDSFRARMALLKANPRYRTALAQRDGRNFVTAVSRVWATDPLRGSSVLKTYDAHFKGDQIV